MLQIVPIKACFDYAKRGGLLVLLTIMLAACNPAPAGLEVLHDYQLRVSNTVEQEPLIYTPTPPLRPPSVRQFRLDLPSIQISLLDSMRLDACSAGALIAERNSSLGRLMRGVQRYYHDRKLLDALYLCIDQMDGQHAELAERILEQAELKKRQLPALRMQAIITDSSLQQLLRVGDRPLAEPDPALLAPLLSALTPILKTLDTKQELPNEHELLKALELLEKSPYVGQLWRALIDNNAYLQQMEPRARTLSAQAGCQAAGVPQRAKTLRQVFIARFSGPVQHHLSQLTYQAQQLEPYLTQLQTPIAVLNDYPAFTEWDNYLAQLIALDEGLTATTKQHVQYWQQLFAACGFAPGG